MPPISPCLKACARTRPVWRCSSSFTSVGKPARADRPTLPERGGHGGPDASSRPPDGTGSRNQKKGRKNMGSTQQQPKTKIVVAVVRVIPVAIGTARVDLGVVPRAPAHDRSRPPGRPGVQRPSTSSLVLPHIIHALRARILTRFPFDRRGGARPKPHRPT
jgi:hypothetical protein